jgi:hypothetical protein
MRVVLDGSMSDVRGPDRRTAVDGRRRRARRPRLAGIPPRNRPCRSRGARFRGLFASPRRASETRRDGVVRFAFFRESQKRPSTDPLLSLRSSDYYSSQPPPEEEGSIWGWLTGADDEPANRGGAYSNGSGGYGTSAAAADDDTFTWLANSANFYAGELSRNVKSMTDALAEELLGPAEDEEGEEIEEEDASVRGTGEVVAGGATVKVGRRQKKKEEAPPPKPKPKRRTLEEEEDDEDDVIGGVLNLLGLEDDEEDEPYVRRDTKKDK